MADSVVESVQMDADIDEIFTEITKWGSSTSKEVKRARILEGARGESAKVEYVLEAFGRGIEYVLDYKVTKPERIDFSLVKSTLLRKLDGYYLLESKGGGTLCTYSLKAELKIPLPGFLKRKIAKRIVESALYSVKRKVES